MAKLLFGAIVSQARNKFAGTVFSANYYGAYLKKKTSPGAAKTPASSKSTNALTATARAWNNLLTQDERNSWISLAQATPVLDVFGNTQHLSGIAMFIRVNKELKVLSGTGEPASPYEVPALLYHAPPDQLTFDIGGITPSYTAGPPYSLKLTVTNTPSGHDQLVIAASGFLSPGRKVPKANRIPYVADVAANTTGPFDFTLYWNAKYGSVLHFGSIAVAAYTIRNNNGAAGPRYAALLSIT